MQLQTLFQNSLDLCFTRNYVFLLFHTLAIICYCPVKYKIKSCRGIFYKYVNTNFQFAGKNSQYLLLIGSNELLLLFLKIYVKSFYKYSSVVANNFIRNFNWNLSKAKPNFRSTFSWFWRLISYEYSESLFICHTGTWNLSGKYWF